MTSAAQWTWSAGTLGDGAGQTLATAFAEQLCISPSPQVNEGCDLGLETSMGGHGPERFYLRASTQEGLEIIVRQPGLSITVLRARCTGSVGANQSQSRPHTREYVLERSSFLGRQRRIRTVDAEGIRGAVLCTTRPSFGGDLRVQVLEDIPTIDAIVLSYCCYRVDASPKIVRA